MQVTTKKLPKSQIELVVTVDGQELTPYRKQAIARISKEAKIPGFRAGHISEDKLIEKVGKDVIERETVDIALPQIYATAVQQEKIQAVARPEISVTNMKPFQFTAKVPVLSEVKLGDYQKIKLKKEDDKVSDKELADAVADIRKRNAETIETKDRAAKQGDKVEVDFSGSTKDGVVLDGTSSKNHPFVLGEGDFIPGFEEGIIGMQIGDERVHPVKFPADYSRAKHLAGKEVQFKIKLNKLFDLKEPELSDEFALKVSGGKRKKWSEVETDLNNYLQSRKTQIAQEKMENELIQELLKICEIEIPDALIIEEVEYMLKDFKKRLEGGGLTLEKYLEQSKKTEADLRKEMLPEAENRIKVRLIVNKIVEVEKVNLTEEEVKSELEKIKSRHPTNEATKIEQNFAPLTPVGQQLRQQIKITKLLSSLTNKLST